MVCWLQTFAFTLKHGHLETRKHIAQPTQSLDISKPQTCLVFSSFHYIFTAPSFVWENPMNPTEEARFWNHPANSANRRKCCPISTRAISPVCKGASPSAKRYGCGSKPNGYTFWEDYHLLKGFLGSWGVRGFDPLPYPESLFSIQYSYYVFFQESQFSSFFQ